MWCKPFTANTLLALGASPAMVMETEEASQFAAIASALCLINVGTLERSYAHSRCVPPLSKQKALKHPGTLDPVAVGGTGLSPPFLSGTLSHKPTAIRGNASEIMALAGAANGGRGGWIPLTPQLTR